MKDRTVGIEQVWFAIALVEADRIRYWLAIH